MSYLHWIRNLPSGLRSRSSILSLLKTDSWTEVSAITEQVAIKHPTVLYHLFNMEREEIVEREPDGFRWKIAMSYQLQLPEFLTKKRSRTSKRK